MDCFLPDEDSIARMNEEYAKLKKLGLPYPAAALGSEENASASGSKTAGECGGLAVPLLFLLLYFAYVLGYNAGYGIEIHDTDGSVGRLQSGKGTAGNVDNFFGRNR